MDEAALARVLSKLLVDCGAAVGIGLWNWIPTSIAAVHGSGHFLVDICPGWKPTGGWSEAGLGMA
jgi:hypothetical protein